MFIKEHIADKLPATVKKERRKTFVFKEALLEAQFETAPDGILVVNPGGKILARNALFGKMWRIPAKILATNNDKTLI